MTFHREWQRPAAPGTWFSGAERVAIAGAARGEAAGNSAPRIAAPAIHDHPAELRRTWLAALEAQGLTLHAYVEVLGVVAPLRALDTLMFGLGVARRRLPDPVRGEPTRRVVDAANIDGAWVPSVGPAWPPTVLSSVAAENEAMDDLLQALYLAISPDHDGNSVGNMAAVRNALSRSQMEFVAPRTSLLNDCFF